MNLQQDSGDKFLEQLEKIGAEDAAGLRKAAESYGNSWKSRGGVGAFMMLARKWDRLENRVKRGSTTLPKDVLDVACIVAMLRSGEVKSTSVGVLQNHADVIERVMGAGGFGNRSYDLFAHIAADQRAEGVIDDVRDLRRYLMLVEAEMRARGFDATHRDNKPDA